MEAKKLQTIQKRMMYGVYMYMGKKSLCALPDYAMNWLLNLIGTFY